MADALSINWQVHKGGSIALAIRKKLRKFYFVNPDFDVLPFNEMDVVLMPYLLQLVTRTEIEKRSLFQCTYCLSRIGNLNGIFRLLRNCHVPELFSFPSPESLLCQKNEQIKHLEVANADLKAKCESINEKFEQLKRENEELRRAASVLPNKRAKASDVESRLAALEDAVFHS